MSWSGTSERADAIVRVSKTRRTLRLVLASAFLMVAGVGSVFLWQFTTLSGLPDIGDPFDVAKYARVEIPADENAYTFYQRAYEMSKGINCPRSMAGNYSDWNLVDADQLKYLEDSRAAMAVWLEGTRRTRAVYIQPGEATVETLLPVTQESRNFARRMNLQAFKLQHEGDLAGSWTWVRANLRTSRHMGMNGFLIERLVGNAIFTTASKQANVWADDPRVDASMLRNALDDVLALDALDRSPTHVVRSEYFSAMSALRNQATSERMLMFTPSAPPQHPTWKQKMGERIASLIATLRHEPERSRRVSRLITANLLSACDLPPEERKQRVRQFGKLTLLAPAPGDQSAISLEELARWFESTRYAKELLSPWLNVEQNALARDETARAGLIIHLAEQLYKREKGREPTSVEELVGPYLKVIPQGYVAPTAEQQTQGAPK
jgi:hypothetical protein